MARQIVDLQPHPQLPGASVATFDDGGIYTVPTGPIQAAYQQQKAQQQAAMLASNDRPSFLGATPEQMGMRTDAGPQMTVAPEAAARFDSVAKNVEAKTAKESKVANVLDKFSQPPAAPAPAPSYQAAPQSRVAEIPETAVGGSEEVGLINAAGFKWTPQDEAMARLHPELTRSQILAIKRPGGGTPAITQAQLQKRSTQGVVMPTAHSVSVTDKAPVTEDEINHAGQLQIQAAEATAKSLNSAAEATLENNRLVAQQAKLEADKAAAIQAHKEAAWNQAWNKFNTQYDPNNPDNQIDPRRFFKRAGVIGSVVAIIGGGLSEAANILSHRNVPNALDQILQRDVDAQIQDLQYKRGQANSQLAMLSQQFGSVEAGATALKILQRNAIDTKLTEMMGYNLAKSEKERIESTILTNRAKAENDVMMLKALYGGKIAEQTQGAIVYPQAAKGPAGPAYNLDKAEAMGKSNAELGIKVAARHDSEHSPQGRAERLSHNLAPLDEVKDAVEAYYKARGLTRDENGKWVKTGDDPLAGPVDMTRNAIANGTHAIGGEYLRSDAAKDAIAKKNVAVEALGRARSGAAISEHEWGSFDRQIAGDSGANVVNAANSLSQMTESKIKDLRAGAGSEAVDLYDSQKRRETARQADQNRAEGRIRPGLPGGR